MQIIARGIPAQSVCAVAAARITAAGISGTGFTVPRCTAARHAHLSGLCLVFGLPDGGRGAGGLGWGAAYEGKKSLCT